MSCKPSARRGFTLSEMLAVLAVLVALGGFSWPALRTALDNSRLRNAAKEVCVELSKARLRAMQSGAPQQFRYQRGTGRFELTDRTAPGDETDPSSTGQGRLAGRADRDAQDARREECERHDLPMGVSFAEPAANELAPADAADRLADRHFADNHFADNHFADHRLADDRTSSDPEGEDEEAWSTPIVFFPDGKTSDASIRLNGRHEAYVDVRLRGLTGVATATAPHREEERR
jgi:prepilin-type N-terminal cleavage/methylation domain-containing protein